MSEVGERTPFIADMVKRFIAQYEDPEILREYSTGIDMMFRNDESDRRLQMLATEVLSTPELRDEFERKVRDSMGALLVSAMYRKRR